MKCRDQLCVFLFILSAGLAASKEKCERCTEADSCQFFNNLNSEDQSIWRNRYDCGESTGKSGPIYGFSSSAKGDSVCCPETVWNVDNPSGQLAQNSQDSNATDDPVKIEKNSFFSFLPNIFSPNYLTRPTYPKPSYNNPGYNNPGYNNPGYNKPGHNNPGYNNQNGKPPKNQYGNPNQNGYQVYENTDDRGPQTFDNGVNNQYGGQGYHQGGNQYDNQRTPSPWANQRQPKQPTKGQNPYFLPVEGKDNSYNGVSVEGQCPVTIFPPDPSSGCCGVEAADPDSLTGTNSRYPNTWMPQASIPSSGYRSPWLPFADADSDTNSESDSARVKRQEVNVTVDNRIAGGKETQLEQFPWTVLLKTIFQYPDKDVAFSCGGSLISSRYVLTAGHCIFDSKGTVKDVEINLAEYDKRTFPRDCKNVLGRGQVCVENIVMHAESVHLHPEYDDNRLNNDIALIRLRGDAPYTDYIRPICLPPINVDSPQLSNLRLAVAGWGRNGQYKSNIKQSTVVNLVPYNECRQSYPSLTRMQVCAAGYTGEDTCKGDSGGPLMLEYGGKYYVSGVVSGKRADAPCGTSVPSLYTNVYQYLPWIRNVIAN